jgi:hypothetical protein
MSIAPAASGGSCRRTFLHTTVYRYFWEWHCYGVLDRIHQALLEQCRKACGREPDPTAAIIDTQVAKAT